MAVADLDMDGHPEIVLQVYESGSRAAGVLDSRGALLAASTRPVQGIPVIADVDGIAPAEIVFEGGVFRFRPKSPVLEPVASTGAAVGAAESLVADLDGDGAMELVTGPGVFDPRTGARRPSAVSAAFPYLAWFSAAGDFNRDGRGDIVHVAPRSDGFHLAVFDFANDRLLWARRLEEGLVRVRPGGPPLLDDLDGDGDPEIVVAGTKRLCAFSARCARTPRPRDCLAEGILWCSEIKDESSGYAAATSFDLDGDGAPEVIFRDECWFRILEGPTGRTLAARPMTSGTAAEGPTVADLDGDGHAEIVVTSNRAHERDYCSRDPGTRAEWTGSTEGVFVFRDPQRRWMPTRRIWTSHSFHGTEIDDQLRVPAVQQPSWTAHNTFRRNQQKNPSGWLPDLTASRAPDVDNGGVDCATTFRLSGRVCHRGTGIVAAGLAGSFYFADPGNPGARPVCTARTAAPLYPGECQVLQCDWKSPSSRRVDVWFRVGDDGTRFPLLDECRTGNNAILIADLDCREVG